MKVKYLVILMLLIFFQFGYMFKSFYKHIGVTSDDKTTYYFNNYLTTTFTMLKLVTIDGNSEICILNVNYNFRKRSNRSKRIFTFINNIFLCDNLNLSNLKFYRINYELRV